jgi:hypothetical protein
MPLTTIYDGGTRVIGGSTAIQQTLHPTVMSYINIISQNGYSMSLNEIDAVNNFTWLLVTSGLWSKLIAIYPIIGASGNTHRFNLKDPRDDNAAFRLSFSGTWTHGSTGMTPNGTNAFANTFLNPSTQLTVSANSVSFYSRTQSIVGLPYDIGATTDGAANLNPYGLITRYNTGRSYYMNGNYGILPLNGSSLGFFLGFNDSTNSRLHRNGTLLATIAIPTATLPNFNLYIGANNSGGVASLFSNKECAFASIGNSKLTTNEAVVFYNLVQAFQTKLGRQV